MGKKLKVLYGSDLHLERYTLLKPDLFDEDLTPLLPKQGGDVLVLAGDICSYQALEQENAQGERAKEFLVQLGSKFDRVFWIPGNHENWSSEKSVEEGERWLSRFLQSEPRLANYEILSQGHSVYKGVHFLGTMLWSHMSGVMINEAQRGISTAPDFCEVLTKPGTLMNVPSWTERHREAVRWLKREFSSLARMDNSLLQVLYHIGGDRHPLVDRVVVVTHCSPTYRTEDKYFAGKEGSQLFYTSMDGLLAPGGILSGATCWVHGHTHSPKTTRIGSTRILCNPIGYPRWYKDTQTYEPQNRKFSWKSFTV